MKIHFPRILLLRALRVREVVDIEIHGTLQWRLGFRLLADAV
jgi:hypothetical protein